MTSHLDTYRALCAAKRAPEIRRGIDKVPALNSTLKDHQLHGVEFALRTGSAALFYDTGLGKTRMMLEWGRCVVEHTNKPVLMLAPLAVTAQHLREAEAIGVDARLSRFGQPPETARIVAGIAPSEPICIWVDTDYEAEAIRAAVPEAVEVSGKMSPDVKEERLDGFSTGAVRILLTKPSIAGYGLNWQHCNEAIFTGLLFSYEAFYQAVRRFYRFGQKRQVNAHVVMADTEAAIYDVVQRKSGDHATMKSAMADAMRRASVSHAQMQSYQPSQKAMLPAWIAA